MPKPSITREAFAALAARAGVPLTPPQMQELYEGYVYVEEMASRVRGGGKRPVEAEPSVTFKARG
jgi:hypothetical protein